MRTKKITIAALFITSCLTFSVGVIAQEPFYERSVNNLGKVTRSQYDVDISRISQMLLPNGWLMSFMSDDMRNLVVSWDHEINGRVVNWHDALRQIGQKEHLVFLVDGAERHVYVTYPGYGRDPGVEIINSTSVVFKDDLVSQEIINRAKANEMNWKRRQIQEELGRYHTEKNQLASQLDQLNEQKEQVERQLERLNVTTSEAINVVEASKREQAVLDEAQVIQQKQSEVAKVAGSAEFVFFVKSGLVLNDNAKRFAKDIGYEILVIDRRIPVNCDWQQDVEYTITGRDQKQAFADYVAPYGFKPNFTNSMVELVYVGNPDKFKGCA